MHASSCSVHAGKVRNGHDWLKALLATAQPLARGVLCLPKETGRGLRPSWLAAMSHWSCCHFCIAPCPCGYTDRQALISLRISCSPDLLAVEKVPHAVWLLPFIIAV